MYQMQCSLSLLSLYILCFKKVDTNFVTCVSTNYCIIWHNWNLISCIKINQPLHFVLTHIPFYIREKNNTFHLQPEFYHHGLYAYSTAYHPHTGFPHLVFLNKLALKVVKLCVAYPHAFFFYKYRYISIGKWFTSKISSHVVLEFLCFDKWYCI